MNKVSSPSCYIKGTVVAESRPVDEKSYKVVLRALDENEKNPDRAWTTHAIYCSKNMISFEDFNNLKEKTFIATEGKLIGQTSKANDNYGDVRLYVDYIKVLKQPTAKVEKLKSVVEVDTSWLGEN
jgi:hypothetical protein